VTQEKERSQGNRTGRHTLLPISGASHVVLTETIIQLATAK